MRADRDAHYRSIMKAVSYRFFAGVATATIVFAFTRRLALSLGVGAVEAVVKIFCYYVHERLWSFIRFGRKEHPLSSIPVERELDEKDMQEIKAKLQNMGYVSED